MTSAVTLAVMSFPPSYDSHSGPALNNLILHFQNEFYTYDPTTKLLRRESLNVNKTFLKRYFLIEKGKFGRLSCKNGPWFTRGYDSLAYDYYDSDSLYAAKDANIIGILAGTLGVANYLDIIKRLKGKFDRWSFLKICLAVLWFPHYTIFPCRINQVSGKEVLHFCRGKNQRS